MKTFFLILIKAQLTNNKKMYQEHKYYHFKFPDSFLTLFKNLTAFVIFSLSVFFHLAFV